MKNNLKILLYGKSEEAESVRNYICNLLIFSNTIADFICVTTWDDMETFLVDSSPDLVVVFADGAEGMEAVYLSRRRKPDSPVCWFSDDHDFGMQSHRLECVYFSAKPITEEKLRRALTRYLQMC